MARKNLAATYLWLYCWSSLKSVIWRLALRHFLLKFRTFSFVSRRIGWNCVVVVSVNGRKRSHVEAELEHASPKAVIFHNVLTLFAGQDCLCAFSLLVPSFAFHFKTTYRTCTTHDCKMFNPVQLWQNCARHHLFLRLDVAKSFHYCWELNVLVHSSPF